MSDQIVPNLLRRMTVRRLLELLQEHGPCTRATLSRLSGISAPTVSNAVSTLLERGLIEEDDPPSGGIGRPARVVRLASEHAQVIGIVLDVKSCHVVAAGIDGSLVESAEVSFRTPQDYQTLLDKVEEGVRSLMHRGGVTTLAIGISLPGLVNRNESRSVFSPNLHLTDGKSLADDLGQRLGMECVMVQENQALCLAQRLATAAESLDDFVVLDISGGLGLGVVLEGRLISGAEGMAGELGHITVDPQGILCGCGNHGCLETVATDMAFAAKVSRLVGESLTIDEIVERSRSGAIDVTEPLRESCEYLAIATSAAINLFNPRAVFIYGRIFDVQEGTLELVIDRTRRRALEPSFRICEIRRATGTKQQGAVAVAIGRLTQEVGPSLA